MPRRFWSLIMLRISQTEESLILSDLATPKPSGHYDHNSNRSTGPVTSSYGGSNISNDTTESSSSYYSKVLCEKTGEPLFFLK